VSATSDPDLPRRFRAWLLVLAFAVPGLAAIAEPVGDLYSVTVPYSGDNDIAFRQAMRDVLTRAGRMRRTCRTSRRSYRRRRAT
jgi:hypothetical protein